ncbi:MAG: hypothetical protein HQL95_15970, partial [Magnetococcales bacterium]|nr:hypothetical protein [Magnetococcales bacterium]
FAPETAPVAMNHLERFRVASPKELDRAATGHYGFFSLPLAGLEIASTELRRRLHAGESLRTLTPEAVIDYAHTHGLYGANHENVG